MKRTIIVSLLLLLFTSYGYSDSSKRIYLWVDYPAKDLFARGASIKLNGVFLEYVRQGSLYVIHVKGDKKYKLDVEVNGAVMASSPEENLADENTYYHADLKITGSKMEKLDIDAKRDFVDSRRYANTVDFYEPGMKDGSSSNSATAYGSCFLISADGYIVTNYHVVEGYSTIKIKGIEGNYTKEYEANVIVKDLNNDLVLLKLKDSTVKFTAPPYALRTQGISTGEDVSVLGYPLGPALGEEIKLTTGVVSAKSGVGGNVGAFQISAAAQPGNSGGPLFDGHGNVIGVVNAKIRNAENITYAVKAIYIQTLLSMLPEEAKLPANNTILDKPLPERVAAASKFVYIIKCE